MAKQDFVSCSEDKAHIVVSKVLLPKVGALHPGIVAVMLFLDFTKDLPPDANLHLNPILCYVQKLVLTIAVQLIGKTHC